MPSSTASDPNSSLPKPTGKVVLVVDDSQIDRLILKHLLATLGYAVIEAASGEEGLACLAVAGDVAVILVDWNMPAMSGIEFVQKVRADPVHGQMPIMMATCRNSREDVSEALEAGANEYMTKSYSSKVLRSKLSLLKLSPR